MNRLNIQDKNSISEFCRKLDCTEKELMYCVSKVGTSLTSIECYMHMNRSLLEQWSGQSSKVYMSNL